MSDQTLKALQALVLPGAVVELRVPEFEGRKTNVLSGYYDNLEALIRDARKVDGKAAGIYFTMNPVSPELLARRVNRFEQYAKLTTADHDIARRRWALIDIDPVRAAGICATDAQHDAAHVKADKIEDYLTGLDFPEPMRMDSGNGAYLLYPVDLPNDATSLELVHGFLKSLAARFDDETTGIDVSVANAARIIRIPGTLNAKGDSTPDRPHRRARLLSMPEDRVAVVAELLATVVPPTRSATNGQASTSQQATTSSYDATADIEKMAAWLEEHGLDTRNGKPWKRTGYRWELEACPFNPDHDRGEAWVCVQPSGAKAAGCRHSSCTWGWRELRAKVELPSPYSGADDDERKQVDVCNDAEAADWLRNELGRGELAGIFRREDLLVHTPRMGEDGYIPPEVLGLVDAGPAQVRPITTTQVKSLIETRYQCWKTAGSGDNRHVVAALFPQQSATSACESARLGEYSSHLKVLHGVTHTPTIRPDGTILDRPGYDVATRLLYLPDLDLTIPSIPDQPTAEQVKTAVELIREPVAEFPFVSENDRATWIGLAFTPILRPLLPGPYQLGVITATNPGSGKTKLAKMITNLHGGVLRSEMPREADELRKSITAALVDHTAPVVGFDNLRGVIRSSVLEGLLTDKTWTDRWLGQNRQVTVANDRLWIVTGNNVAFGGDLARRLATVALNPPEANHHLRTDFKIEKLDDWMAEHRGQLLAAFLTIARGWVVAGRPGKRVRSDSYAEWLRALRGMMQWAGFQGTFGGGVSTATESADDEEWRTFLVELNRQFDAELFTVNAIVERLNRYTNGSRQLDSAALPGDLPQKWGYAMNGNDGSFRKSLGWWLKNHEGRYAGQWTLRSAGKDGYDRMQYFVETAGGA